MRELSHRLQRSSWSSHWELRAAFWLAAGVTAGLLAWEYRQVISSDTISHLDMADAYFRGDWKMVVTGHWNPLYAWLLGLAMRVARPSPYWEYPTVHFVIFAVFLFAMGCFDFFLRELIRFYNAMQRSDPLGEQDLGRTERVWLILAYTLFLWSSLHFIGLDETNPDMLVAAFVYLACGLLLRIRSGTANRMTFALFGFVLGLGYLTKQIMFPLAFIFLGVGLFSVGNLRRAAPRVLIALVTFISLSAPLVVAISVTKGRLTFGDSGQINYAFRVNHVPYRHWQGQPPGSGTPVHPTRKIYERPATFEFARPILCTYPLWYDITYWYEGLRIHFDFADQVKATRQNLIRYLSRMLGKRQAWLNGSVMTGLLVVVFASSRGWFIIKDLSEFWFLTLPAAAALGIYSLVLIESRYIAPFVTVFVLTVFFGACLRGSRENRRLVSAVAATILLVLVTHTIPEVYSSARDLLGRRGTKSLVYWEVANDLRRMGVKPGDKIASISYANMNNVKWARLARVQIIAEVYHTFYLEEEQERNDFWKADPSVQNEILQAFANVGVCAVVSDEQPRGPGAANWQKIGNTSYYVYFLPRSS